MKQITFISANEAPEELIQRSLSLSALERLQILQDIMKLGFASGIDQSIFDERAYVTLRKA